MAKDIVCNNEIDMGKERFRSWHDGREFWFDSRECKSLFDADPDKYIKVELRAEGERAETRATEPGQKVHEIGERAVERSKSHAKAIFADRKRDLAETASGISHALHEASKNLRDQHYEDTARFVDKSAEQVDS
ncbi:MAG: YHS domain-containing protein, partial [Deltaproteobacteria bacterium]|nr:YHS domain-containing protein [Deltaproteobacteria bacterium]